MVRSLASLFGGTVLALTLFGAVNAGAAIDHVDDFDYPADVPRRLGTELLVDWNQDFTICPDLGTEDTERPALPSLSPDEPQTSDAADAERGSGCQRCHG